MITNGQLKQLGPKKIATICSSWRCSVVSRSVIVKRQLWNRWSRVKIHKTLQA